MYFLNDEERKRLLKGILPKTREMGVADELRGWNWHQPPLEPIYEVPLALYEVAGKYCPSSRDVFLRRVRGLRPQPNLAMMEGAVFHDLLVDLILRTKRLIYTLGVNRYDEILAGLVEPDLGALERVGGRLGAAEKEAVADKCRVIWNFEAARISSRIQDCLARQPYVGEDSLVALAVPVVVEQKLDGRFLGLSQMLSSDALTFSEPMILDLKFGPRRDFHRLGTAGYALVTESIYEFPVNLGCVVYASFHRGRLIIDKDFHMIDDELRQWFIEERDERMRMVYDELDPGLAEECYEDCPLWGECKG